MRRSVHASKALVQGPANLVPSKPTSAIYLGGIDNDQAEAHRHNSGPLGDLLP